MRMQVGEKAGVARAPHKQHHPPSLRVFPLGPELWEDKTNVGRSMAKVPFLLCSQQLHAYSWVLLHASPSFIVIVMLAMICGPQRGMFSPGSWITSGIERW